MVTGFNKTYRVYFILVMLLAFYLHSPLFANTSKERIIFIPLDNRPITMEQTAEIVEAAGYEILMPPKEILGGRDFLGDTDKLWKWLQEKAPEANHAVISADTMIYGSLVASRKHGMQTKELQKRVARFYRLKQKNPDLNITLFASVMRTPKSGGEYGSEEKEYYKKYGKDIFEYTALLDKKETQRLSLKERVKAYFYSKSIPQQVLNDWNQRRETNIEVSKTVLDLCKMQCVNFLTLGKDDNAQYSQTQMDNRKLVKYAINRKITNYTSIDGIDEIGLILLTRVINHQKNCTPSVFVTYNKGAGKNAIPSYTSQKISNSINSEILLANGKIAKRIEKADFVLVVNTSPDGKTVEANSPENNDEADPLTSYTIGIINKNLKKKYKVGIADIFYANGSDNSLMEELRKQNLLFEIMAYSGWNTATNSTGFCIGMGLLTMSMPKATKDKLLFKRYLDDWAYQANIRTAISKQLQATKKSQIYALLNEHKFLMEARVTKHINNFVKDKLSSLYSEDSVKVTFPWNRMFEAEITLIN